MRLIWMSNNAAGSTLTLRRSPISRASTILLWCLTLRNCCWKALSLARASRSSSLLGSSSTASPQAARNRLVSLGLASISQRRKVMPLVLLVMRRIEMIEIVEHGLLHQIGMHRRDAVDAVRADESELPHPHPASGLLVDQRH